MGARISGLFPVTAVFAWQAVDVLWLTLENEAGEATRMGVNAEHPFFTVGQGRITAGELAPGYEIRNADLLALTVLAVTADIRPHLVHNVGVADAHTSVGLGRLFDTATM